MLIETISMSPKKGYNVPEKKATMFFRKRMRCFRKKAAMFSEKGRDVFGKRVRPFFTPVLDPQKTFKYCWKDTLFFLSFFYL